MSNTQLSYNSPDHPAFSGGRYLKAFDHLHDIDHYEHSILTYLGSLMPFDKGFIDHPAFPSIATIARSTKISESTVRKKLRTLESKRYLKTKTVRFLNSQGKFQQSSNDYHLTTTAFDIYTDVVASRNQIHHIRKRSNLSIIKNTSPSSTPSAPHTPPRRLAEQPHSPLPTLPHREPLPNSLKDNLRINPQLTASYSEDRDIRAEVDRIIEAWEDVIKKPVTKGQKESFLQQYVRINGHEIFYMERILKVASDPYLLSRAQSINFLFTGLDVAEKNKRDITQSVDRAFSQARSPADLQALITELPDFITKKSRNFCKPSPAVIDALIHGSVRFNEARPESLGKDISNSASM